MLQACIICLWFICEGGYPHHAVAHVIGRINGQEFGISQILANISRTGHGTNITAELIDVPPEIGISYRLLHASAMYFYMTGMLH